MTSPKRHPIGAPEIVQYTGLLILIALIYKRFGPGGHTYVSALYLVLFAVALFLVVWPVALKTRNE